MLIKQLSVFIENRKGRLEQVVEVLTKAEFNIVSLSLADTNEYGLLRLIVSDPDKAKAVLREEGFSATLTQVLAVKLPNQTGALHRLLKALSNADMNVEYMYVLDSGLENGSMIVKVTDPEAAVAAVREAGMEVFDEATAYSIQHD